MNIALIAHDDKKELMIQFCIAYCGILSRHNLCATGTTGKIIRETTGLNVNCFMPGAAGGGEQIAARIGYNELDLLIFFREPFFALPILFLPGLFFVVYAGAMAKSAASMEGFGQYIPICSFFWAHSLKL